MEPAFIGPARARDAVNDGFGSFPGSESQAVVLGHLPEIASVLNTERCFPAPPKHAKFPALEYVIADVSGDRQTK
jgi:hypothetical protein